MGPYPFSKHCSFPLPPSFLFILATQLVFSGPALLTLVPLSWSHVKRVPLFPSGIKPSLILHTSVPLSLGLLGLLALVPITITTLPPSTYPLCLFSQGHRNSGPGRTATGAAKGPMIFPGLSQDHRASAHGRIIFILIILKISITV